MSNSDSENVQIVIKRFSSGGSSSVDHTLRRPLDSNIESLKKEITECYSEKPQPNTQKIIFAGKVLADNQILRDILRHHDKSLPISMHLLISNSQVPPMQYPSNNQPEYPPLPQHRFAFNAPPPPYVYPGAYAAYQRGPPNFAAPMPPYMQQPYPPQPQQQQQPQGNNPAFHEWLIGAFQGHDYVFMFKLAILVFFFSQGGSTERMIFFSIIAVLAYLYNTGRFRFRVNVAVRRGVEAQNNQNERPAEQPAQQPQPQPAQPQPAQQPQEPLREDDIGLVWQPEPINPNQSQILRELKEFFYPLVLSLYPNYQFRPRPQPEAELQPQQPTN